MVSVARAAPAASKAHAKVAMNALRIMPISSHNVADGFARLERAWLDRPSSRSLAGRIVAGKREGAKPFHLYSRYCRTRHFVRARPPASRRRAQYIDIDDFYGPPPQNSKPLTSGSERALLYQTF
jgi:hypothetical protein